MSNIEVICKEYVDLICKKIVCDGHMKKMIREAIEKTVSFVAISPDSEYSFPIRGDVDAESELGYQLFPIIELDSIVDIDYDHGDS